MEFRQIDKSFEKQLGNLFKWNFSSDVSSPIFKYFFSLPSYWANIYGWIDGQDLVSIWNQVPIELVIRRKKVKAYFVEDAITEPNYRNRGLIKQAFLANCHKAQEENIDFIALTPFKHKYYHNFGFASAFNRFRLKTPLSLITKTAPSDDFYIKMGDLGNDKQLQTDFYALLEEYWNKSIYNEVRYIDWGDKYLEYVKDRRIAIVYDAKKGTQQGFLFYGEKNRKITINGFRYNSFGAFNALKNFITAFHDQVDSIHCTALPEDFPIEIFTHSYWIGNDAVIFSYEPSKMLRVVSPKSVLEKFLAVAPKESIRLLLKDPILPENSGVYTITENMDVQFLTDQTDTSYDLEISIHALAQLITGRFSAYDLYRCGELVIPEKTEIYYMDQEMPEKILELDKLYPKMVTFYPEYD
ncbi:MAG: GNAT family N-acetyltransferase [Promethearchaeota archaeon]